MKRLQIAAAYLLVLALVGVSSLKSAEPGKSPGHALVRTVKGTATYTTPGGASNPLTVNTELSVGDKITTGPDSFVYLSVNGLSSAVRIASDTTLVLDKMERIGTSREGGRDTMLNLRIGSIVGQVRKVSAESRYEIMTPHGVAGIRGTDFAVDVVSDGNGQYTVTFTSITGTVVASAVVNGNIETKTLTAGEAWTVGGDVRTVKVDWLEDLILGMMNFINPIPPGPPGVPTGPQPRPPSG
jgi:hypothetical protein